MTLLFFGIFFILIVMGAVIPPIIIRCNYLEWIAIYAFILLASGAFTELVYKRVSPMMNGCAPTTLPAR